MGKTNCTVYGVCTDNKLFIFYEIDNDGKVIDPGDQLNVLHTNVPSLGI